MKTVITGAILFFLMPAAAACQLGEPVNDDGDGRETAEAQALAPAAGPLPGPAAADVGEAAWSYVERNSVAATGLVGATEHYDMLTTWDLGSVLAATYSARALGLIDEEEYRGRMSKALATLAELPLFDGVAFNKAYDATTGRMVDRQEQPSDRGYGWSVLDLGRVLAWLEVVENGDPEHAEAARSVAARFDYSRLIRDGYLIGANLRSDGGIDTYPEGRIGYEQYAAEAFRRWGHEASSSADVHRHAKPVDVMGHTVYVDERGDDRVTSEPFIMLGLEFGWTEEMAELARNVLGAQRARHEQTGVVTVVSEDAMTEAPYYFYYYSVYADGHPFAVDAQGAPEPMDGPRWVSAKAAYGWHSLLPDDYTRLGVETVAPAMADGRGWFSGVYEGTSERAGSMNLNTAALILEALLYRERGAPLASAP